jgi:predicted ATPase
MLKSTLRVRTVRRVKLNNSIRFQTSAINSKNDDIKIRNSTSRVLETNKLKSNLPTSNFNSTAITITDPYIIYKNLVDIQELDSDPHQLALVKKLSLLSKNLQNYKPDLTTVKINRLVRELEIKYNKLQIDNKNVLFGYTIGWFKERENSKLRTQLINVLNDYDELTSSEMEQIPKGLLINGEVGCGKTMLMDLFAGSLPVNGKWRVHWGVFIHFVMKEIENVSARKRDKFLQANHPLLNYENEFVLFEVAARLIEKFHVLILDEFMLPDIASAKIINILFVYYFKLGGVLVASSNRLPEELYSGSINKTTMGDFEKILRARCDVWNMRSDKDYRTDLKTNDIASDKWMILKSNINYEFEWNNLLNEIVDLKKCELNVRELKSYGRDIVIPKVFDKTVAYFDFNDIIEDSKYGPSDFISIATKYPIIVIDNVPILTTKMKNQARRLITFIDAIYDSKCKLIIKLETEPKKLFFPDIKDNRPTRFKCTPLEDSPNPVCLSETLDLKDDDITTTKDLQDLEMFAKTEMDLSNPHRPNFATYEDNNKDYNVSHDEDRLKKNFADMKKFTGEDEMFAYKRAVSRIIEMTTSIRWRKNSWTPSHSSIKSCENSTFDPKETKQ